MSGKVKFRIRTKVFSGVGLLLILAVGSIVWISSELYLKEARLFLLKNASDYSRSTGINLRNQIQAALTRSQLWLETSSRGNDPQNELLQRVAEDKQIAGVGAYDLIKNKWLRRSLPETSYQPDQSEKDFLKSGQPSFKLSSDGKFFRLWYPSVDGAKSSLALCIYLNADFVSDLMLEHDVSQTFLFSRSGDILFSSGDSKEQVFNGVTIPKELLSKTNISLSNIQLNYDSGKESFIGSFAGIGIASLGILVLTPEARVFEVPQKIALRSVLLGLAILSIGLMLAALFSDSLVSPVLSLVEMTRKLAKGDFSQRLKPSTRDEIATLTNSFNSMAQGLAERERLKDVFGKFHSKAIFEKLVNEEELKLGGEQLEVTVLFSDIRSFTSQSEKMTPQNVVAMLNEYMQAMVPVIEANNGVVDKFVGDAIMAVWGLPKPNPKENAKQALKASFEMREKLKELNITRASRGEEPLSIGIGLCNGPVVAGNIGSESRMEYTVIGDTVNTASRMESMCKMLETDFVVHESVQERSQDTLDGFEMQEVQARGKKGLSKVYVLKLDKETHGKAA